METVDKGSRVVQYGDNQYARLDGARKERYLVKDEFVQWQVQWKDILKKSTIYLDTSLDSFTSDRDKSRDFIKLNCFKFHAKVVDFFNSDEVTMIISKRQYDKSIKYPRSDIFCYGDRIRIWSFEKAVRFFGNLSSKTGGEAKKKVIVGDKKRQKTGQESQKLLKENHLLNGQKLAGYYRNPLYQKNVNLRQTYPSTYLKTTSYNRSTQLSTLLTEEKLRGPNDRDPAVRVRNCYYFEYPYLYIFDLKQAYRPMITKEWNVKNYPNVRRKAPWAKFYPTFDGRCPFLTDVGSASLLLLRKKRVKFNDSRKEYRKQLREIYQSEDKQVDEGHVEDVTDNDSTETEDWLQPMKINPQTHKRSFFEMDASGVNLSNSQATNSLMAKTKNGLGAVRSHVTSKEFNSLKRRIYKDEVDNSAKPVNIADKFKRPEEDSKKEKKKDIVVKKVEAAEVKRLGYCENCRIDFDLFHGHITSSKHREFAKEDKNFQEIDSFIQKLKSSRNVLREGI